MASSVSVCYRHTILHTLAVVLMEIPGEVKSELTYISWLTHQHCASLHKEREREEEKRKQRKERGKEERLCLLVCPV